MTATAEVLAVSRTSAENFWAKLALLCGDIRIAHSVFALPFALLAAFLAAGGWIGFGKLGLILVCMVTARTVAMCANRVLDARIDARNPRTLGRAIPSGRLSAEFVTAAMLVCGAAFWAAAAGFWIFYGNKLPAIFAPVILVYVALYPLTKRFTRLCHFYLGAALALAPVCAWIAITGTVGAAAWLMFGVVSCWTAGFDILYACQDYGVDVVQGLHSMPSRLGILPALWVARLTHAASAGLLIVLAATTPRLHWCFAAATAVTVGLLVYEHALVRGGNLKRLGLAFFTINGIISLTLGAAGIVDVLLG